MNLDKTDVAPISIAILMIVTTINLAMTPVIVTKEHTSSHPTTLDYFFNPAYAADPRLEAGEYYLQQKHEQYIEEERLKMLQDSVLIYKLMSTVEGRKWAFETYEEYGKYDPDLFIHYFDYLNE